MTFPGRRYVDCFSAAWITGGIVLDHPPPTESATVVIVAGLLQLDEHARMRYRQWLGKWTDFTGRIITPAEQKHRLEQLRVKIERQDADAAEMRKPTMRAKSSEELGSA